MSDPIQFPPKTERKKMVEEFEERTDFYRQALENMSPQTLRWVARANEVLLAYDRKAVIEKFSSVSHDYLVMCCSLGRELLGDAWDDQNGPHYMAAAISEFIKGSCTQCLMQHHQPELHVVEDEK